MFRREQTANCFCFVTHLLATNPDALERLENEVELVLGGRKTVASADVEQLHYTKCVIKEALRYVAVAFGLVLFEKHWRGGTTVAELQNNKQYFFANDGQIIVTLS